MFSFFKSKKPSPSSSPESERMTGPPSGPTDFVVIEKRDDRPGQPGLYPTFDPSPAHPYAYPGAPHPSTVPAAQPTASNTDNLNPSSYLHGVPFKLSSDLSTNDTSEITKIQIDDILSTITSKMHMSRPDYDFALERSTIAQTAAE